MFQRSYRFQYLKFMVTLFIFLCASSQHRGICVFFIVLSEFGGKNNQKDQRSCLDVKNLIIIDTKKKTSRRTRILVSIYRLMKHH